MFAAPSAIKSSATGSLSMARTMSGSHALAATRSNLAGKVPRAAFRTPLATPTPGSIMTRGPSNAGGLGLSLSRSYARTPGATLNLQLNLIVETSSPLASAVSTLRTLPARIPTPGASHFSRTLEQSAFANAIAENGFRRAAEITLALPKPRARVPPTPLRTALKSALKQPQAASGVSKASRAMKRATVRFTEVSKRDVMLPEVVDVTTPMTNNTVRPAQWKSCRDRVPTPFVAQVECENYFA